MKHLLEKKGAKLYRGTGLTRKDLQAYLQRIGKIEDGHPDWAVLTGFISTSMNRDQAETFAWSNEESGHEATLFEILWKSNLSYYVMDNSAFPDEKEVLL